MVALKDTDILKDINVKPDTNFVKENRIGNFKASKLIIEEQPEDVLLIFSKILIIRCEMVYPDYFEYRGFSKLFRHVEEGHMIPNYDILFHRRNDGSVELDEIKEIFK